MIINKMILVINIFIGLWLLFAGYGSQCYGSSEMTDQSESKPGFLLSLTEKEGDCFAWKFYLLTTMYRLAYTNESYFEKASFIRYGANYKKHHNINIYETFPPETAKKIINMIIEKEGGHCSKKVLYGVQRCAFDPNPHKRPAHWRGGGHSVANTIYDAEFRDAMDFEYFTRAMDFPIDKKLVSQLDYFLSVHAYEYPDPADRVYSEATTSLYCAEDCIRNNRFNFTYFDNFGICMIAKHEKYLKDNNLFYFKYYLHGVPTNSIATLNIPSLQTFVKETNVIAEEYRNKSNLP